MSPLSTRSARPARRPRPWLAVLVVGGSLAVAACEDEVAPAPPPNRGAQAALSAALSASAAPTSTVAPLSEGDFTASDGNRDPFRSYVDQVRPPTTGTQTRLQVLADRFSLDEMKLVALITGNTAPRAMFVDPEGKGWIVTTGQLIGRAEVVKTGGTNGAEYELNWKVDRIRDNDVVFVRENPGRAGAVGATRVVALRTEADERARR